MSPRTVIDWGGINDDDEDGNNNNNNNNNLNFFLLNYEIICQNENKEKHWVWVDMVSWKYRCFIILCQF